MGQPIAEDIGRTTIQSFADCTSTSTNTALAKLPQSWLRHTAAIRDIVLVLGADTFQYWYRGI